jgi:hypothetical protein
MSSNILNQKLYKKPIFTIGDEPIEISKSINICNINDYINDSTIYKHKFIDKNFKKDINIQTHNKTENTLKLHLNYYDINNNEFLIDSQSSISDKNDTKTIKYNENIRNNRNSINSQNIQYSCYHFLKIFAYYLIDIE